MFAVAFGPGDGNIFVISFNTKFSESVNIICQTIILINSI